MKVHTKLLAATGLIAALGLTGCWNDSDEDPVPATAGSEVPDSAGASTGAFIGFVLGLGGNDESSEPLAIRDTFAVPADESAEPTPLN